MTKVEKAEQLRDVYKEAGNTAAASFVQHMIDDYNKPIGQVPTGEEHIS